MTAFAPMGSADATPDDDRQHHPLHEPRADIPSAEVTAWAAARGIPVRCVEGHLVRGRVRQVGMSEAGPIWMRLHTGAVIPVGADQVELLTRPSDAPPPPSDRVLEPYEARHYTYPPTLTGWVGRWVSVTTCYEGGIWCFDPTEPTFWERMAERAHDANRLAHAVRRLARAWQHRSWVAPGDEWRGWPRGLRTALRIYGALCFARYVSPIARRLGAGREDVFREAGASGWSPAASAQHRLARVRMFTRRLRMAWLIQGGATWEEAARRCPRAEQPSAWLEDDED